MMAGFLANFVIGITAYLILRSFTKLRQVDAATVSGYYGSDSAGTFATAVGVLASAKIAYAAYMPVMLAVIAVSTKIHSSPSRNTRTAMPRSAAVGLEIGAVGTGLHPAAMPCQTITPTTVSAATTRAIRKKSQFNILEKSSGKN